MRRTTRLKKPQVPEIEDLYRFDDLGGRPKYGGVEMTHETDIPTYETIMEEVDGKIAVEADARSDEDAALQEDIDNEVLARQGADMALQSQIDAVVAASDVKDIVGTHAALEAYDTSTLGDNDIIKVLQDETRQDQTTYYRWSVAAEEFSLIGSEGPYYTKSQSDTLLNAKQNTLTAGSNVQITNDTISATDTTYTAGTGLDLTGTQFSIDNTTVATQSDLSTGLAGKQDTLTAGANVQISNNTISATDTTYSNFTGTDGTTAGAAGLVPAPATTDAGKFLKADGTWEANSATFYTGENVSDLKVYKASRADEIYGDAFYNDGLVTQYGATHSLRGDIHIPLDANRGAPHGIFVGTGYYPKYADGVSDSRVEGVISIGYDSDARSRYQQGSSTVRTWSPYHISIGHSAGNGFSGTVSSLATTFIGAGTCSTVSGSDMLRDVSVAVGFGSTTSRIDEFSIGAGSANPRKIYTTRYLANVKAGSLDTDAVNVEQLNGRVKTNAGAPTTSTVGTVGQLLEDTTNGKLYICTDATNPYVWEEVGTGGGSSGVSDVLIDGASIVSGGVADVPVATSSSSGVVRVGSSYGTSTTTSGNLFSPAKTYAAYSDAGDYMFIGKGTLENVITGKGLVSNTDYPTSNTGGVIKVNSTYATQVSAAGIMRAVTKSYAAYDTGVDDMFISKGTLENVITGKELVNQTDLATKQDKLTAGTNITIDANNVISATGGGEAISSADWTALWADTLPIMNGVGV